MKQSLKVKTPSKSTRRFRFDRKIKATHLNANWATRGVRA